MVLNEGWAPIVQEKGRVQSAVLKVNCIDLWSCPYGRYEKGLGVADLKRGKPRNLDRMEDGGTLGSQSGKMGGEAELDEDLFVELFEAKEKVRRLEGEVGAWKERYLATSELVDMYEHGEV